MRYLIIAILLLSAARSLADSAMPDEVRAAVVSTLEDWAAAWSAQDPDAFLAHYGDDFQVPGRMSRFMWEGLRRARIERPGHINVDMTFKAFELTSPGVARVTFEQDYASDLYAATTTRTFTLKQQSDRWEIVAEDNIGDWRPTRISLR